MVNSVSVDVEEYYHAANLAPVTPPSRWHSLPSRVELSTYSLLDLFDRTQTKGTFFVLGHVARRRPRLVQEIHRRGHEIGSHGYGHQFAYAQTPRQFFRDVRRTKLLLEDIVGVEILGYRAPNFSITDRNPWAFDELSRAGYRYDSSVFPIWHPRYANRRAPTLPYLIHTPFGSLVEVPLAVRTERILGWSIRIPVAGGAYWRLLPTTLIGSLLSRIQSEEQRPAVCYLHPWELDSDQPRFSGMSLVTRFRHFGGTRQLAGCVLKLLEQFGSSSIEQMLKAHFAALYAEVGLSRERRVSTNEPKQCE